MFSWMYSSFADSNLVEIIWNYIMAGKGDKARNCFSKKYKDNFDTIIWGRKRTKKRRKKIVAIPRPGRYNI